MRETFRELAALAVDELGQVFAAMEEADVRPLLEAIKGTDRIFTAGGGREGLATKAFAMRLMHLGKQSHWIWDDTTPAIGPGDLLVLPCGPGGLGHLDHVVRMAKAHGATVAVLSPSNRGAIVEMADILTRVPAAAYKARGDFVPSKQPMGNLFEQALFVLYDLLVMMLRAETGVTFEQMEARHRNVE